MAAAVLYYSPQDVLMMADTDFIVACKEIFGRTTLPSSSHKGKERPIEEFTHALRKRALRTSGSLNAKGGLHTGMALPKTPDYQTLRNDLVNCVNNPAYAAIRKADSKGDIATVERTQKVRGRGLLRRGIAPAPYKYPKIGAPISYYYTEDDPQAPEDMAIISSDEENNALEKPAEKKLPEEPSLILATLRARRAAIQKAKEDQEAAEAAALAAAAAADVSSLAAEQALAAAHSSMHASLIANMKARDAARLSEQAKLSQQLLATLVSSNC